MPLTPFLQVIPKRDEFVADRRDDADTGDDNSAIVHGGRIGGSGLIDDHGRFCLRPFVT